jgi:hypothetical protein
MAHSINAETDIYTDDFAIYDFAIYDFAIYDFAIHNVRNVSSV